MEEIIKKNILAIIPIYIKGRGNSTLIYTENENIEVYKTIKTVIKNIGKHYHLDIDSVKRTYGEILSLKKFPPIPFTSNNIFIYIKVRKPISIHDGAYGYVKFNAIEKLKEENNKTIIYLKNGETIESLSGVNNINKRINNGKIVKKLCEDRDNPTLQESKEFYINKNQLATKEDIALLYIKISEIKKEIK